MKRVIATSLTLLACSALANDVCSLKPAGADKVFRIQGVPGFFFKVHPDGKYLTFIESEHNTLLDLRTGEELPTVGMIDPVWSPDGKFLTHPGTNFNEETGEMEGLQFYHSRDVLQATLDGTYRELKPFNSKLGGVYQSIGVKDGKYKIITDKDGVSMADFEYSDEGPKQTSEIYRPCQNIPSMGTDLPMLSKDGRFLSAYDSQSGSTKIFKVNGKNCDLSLDLGYGTGKVSFNADSSQIAFHVDQFSEFESGYFSGVGKDKIKNVVVLNLEESPEGKLTPSSWALASQVVKPGNGGYYPDFDKHGNVYFIEDVDNNFQMVKVSADTLEFREMEENLLFGKKHCVSCNGETNVKSATDILAKMWVDICGKEDALPMHHYRELVLAIDTMECMKMVNDFWTPSLEVSKEELLRTCPQAEPKKPEEIGQWDPNQSADAETILKGRCMGCHRTPKTYEVNTSIMVMTGPSKFEEEDYKYMRKMAPLNLEKMDHAIAEEMLQSIQGRSMPKNEPLSDADRKLVTDYLQKRMLDMDDEYRPDYLNVRRYSEEHLEEQRQNALAQIPNAPEEMKQKAIIMVNCIFGQKDCEQHVEHQTVAFQQEAASLPEGEREKFVADKVMELRCSNLMSVTPAQCQDWDRERNR